MASILKDLLFCLDSRTVHKHGANAAVVLRLFICWIALLQDYADNSDNIKIARSRTESENEFEYFSGGDRHRKVGLVLLPHVSPQDSL